MDFHSPIQGDPPILCEEDHGSCGTHYQRHSAVTIFSHYPMIQEPALLTKRRPKRPRGRHTTQPLLWMNKNSAEEIFYKASPFFLFAVKGVVWCGGRVALKTRWREQRKIPGAAVPRCPVGLWDAARSGASLRKAPLGEEACACPPPSSHTLYQMHCPFPPLGCSEKGGGKGMSHRNFKFCLW